MLQEDFQINHQKTVIYSIKSADLLTPVAAFLKLSNLIGKNPANIFLLESVQGGISRARYSIIGLLPDLIWKTIDGVAYINRNPSKNKEAFIQEHEKPLDSLRKLISASQLESNIEMPPMVGGIFGYLGYDMVRQMENLPCPPLNDLQLPEGVMIRPSAFAIFDTVKDELILAAPLRDQFKETFNKALNTLQKIQNALNEPLSLEQKVPIRDQKTISEPVSTFTKEQFKSIVADIKNYIFNGDVFQVVPSQRFSITFTLSPVALYRALRRINPAPFLFCLQLDDFSLIGSSPEILVRFRDGKVTVRPLAGTRPRGENYEEDIRFEKELLSNQKERAEHLMLIDLGRNDVGRVSEIGSVHVTEKFVIERFSHVMHISSNVEGTLKKGLNALDALISGFPAGTLTGAPKIRAMQILDEVEPTRRTTYAGCVGYFGADGSMDTCISLRTALIKDKKMYVQAGCGVVADSDPEAEYQETRQKAKALFRAAEEAWRFASSNKAFFKKAN